MRRVPKWLVALALLWPGALHAEWDRYELIMWQDQTPPRLAALARLGFTAAKLNANRGIDPAALAMRRANPLPYYAENIATDFYAPYHRYTPGQSRVTWLWDLQKERLQQDPTRQDVFVREPGLEDPAWRQRVQDRLTAIAIAQRPDRPLFYTLGDEPGIGDLAAAWDADIAAPSLAQFRRWLGTQYPSLTALNQHWGTAYAAWDAIQPELTDAALTRTDGNYAAWNDFKAFMDTSFAGAVQIGTDALHRGDPAALAALEGAQVPGWGGYDYSLLAPTADVMEIYDSGQALELARAFNPRLIPLRTSFSGGATERYQAWDAFLHGVRGTIMWDDDDSALDAALTPSPRAQAMADQAREFQALAPALWATTPHRDAVAIVVSQTSFRLRWLLDRAQEQRQGGPAWWTRDAEREGGPNAWRSAREQIYGRLSSVGITPVWLATADTIPPAVTVVVLPHTLSLSDNEIASLRTFEARGGRVVADTAPGQYDGHGRRRVVPPAFTVHPALAPRADPATAAVLDATVALLGIAPALRLTDPAGATATGVAIQRLDGPDGTIVAIRSDPPDQPPRQLVLSLPAATALQDLRTGLVSGPADRFDLVLDPVEPNLLRLRP